MKQCNLRKRLLAWILASIMAVSLMPAVAFASSGSDCDGDHFVRFTLQEAWGAAWIPLEGIDYAQVTAIQFDFRNITWGREAVTASRTDNSAYWVTLSHNDHAPTRDWATIVIPNVELEYTDEFIQISPYQPWAGAFGRSAGDVFDIRNAVLTVGGANVRIPLDELIGNGAEARPEVDFARFNNWADWGNARIRLADFNIDPDDVVSLEFYFYNAYGRDLALVQRFNGQGYPYHAWGNLGAPPSPYGSWNHVTVDNIDMQGWPYIQIVPIEAAVGGIGFVDDMFSIHSIVLTLDNGTEVRIPPYRLTSAGSNMITPAQPAWFCLRWFLSDDGADWQTTTPDTQLYHHNFGGQALSVSGNPTLTVGEDNGVRYIEISERYGNWDTLYILSAHLQIGDELVIRGRMPDVLPDSFVVFDGANSPFQWEYSGMATTAMLNANDGHFVLTTTITGEHLCPDYGPGMWRAVRIGTPHRPYNPDDVETIIIYDISVNSSWEYAPNQFAPIQNAPIPYPVIVAPGSIALTNVTASGAAGTETTQELTLTFNGNIAANVITPANVLVTGALVTGVEGMGNTRTVSIVGNWEDDTEATVALIGVFGYTITGYQQVTLHRRLAGADVFINFRHEAVDGQPDIYRMIASATSPLPFSAVALAFSYDNAVVQPVHRNDFTDVTPAIAQGVVGHQTIFRLMGQVYERSWSMAPRNWVVSGGRTATSFMVYTAGSANLIPGGEARDIFAFYYRATGDVVPATFVVENTITGTGVSAGVDILASAQSGIVRYMWGHFRNPEFNNIPTANVPSGVPPVSQFRPGDVNGDGEVNASDIMELLIHWGQITPQSCEVARRADVNSDGEVNASDIMEILANWG
ncbi:MAG: dockerin type I domain-containing protein [Defluviitaleaceae bacterium]|nr:dockerin type I domain-containing protein [Defluviitaleaceae bacterium]